MAYNVSFTKRAAKEFERLVRIARRADRNNLREAIDILRTDPYPTNQSVTPGTIRRLRDSWRIQAGRNYRLRYVIDGDEVVVTKAGDRKDVYDDL